MVKGYFSLVLHAHLPIFSHQQTGSLADCSLFAAISETYIPLLWQLEKKEITKDFTLAFSTPLMEMLADPLLQTKYLQYLYNTEYFLKKKAEIVQNIEGFQQVESYTKRIERMRKTFLQYDQNLLKGFRHFAEEEKVVCICSSATHAFLPYLHTEAGIAAQIHHGIKAFMKHFGYKPIGFWLPECGYSPEIDQILFAEGIRYTFVDELAIKHAAPSPANGVPIASPHGIILFPLNMKVSNQKNKKLLHSQRFINLIKNQLQLNETNSQSNFLIVATVAADLLGHRWSEGLGWLTEVLKSGKNEIGFITAEEYLASYLQNIETAHVSSSALDVLLNKKNSWLYPKLHWIESDLLQLVANYTEVKINNEHERCLKQMAREWMLATSSDWAFMLTQDHTNEYANKRILEHLTRYQQLRDMLIKNELSAEVLARYEAEYPFLVEIDLAYFQSKQVGFINQQLKKSQILIRKKTILMLAWEYPPKIVGGLARHVAGLAKALSNNHCEVHIITTAVTGSPNYEKANGVHVHRVKSLQPLANDFYHWVGSLNLAFCDYVLQLANTIQFDLIHAHDWLVCVAAKALKLQFKLPLVATIHATEHGRNNGIYTPLQKKISHKEWELTYEAAKVIVCSKYMRAEVMKVFQLPIDKIEIIANGVENEKVVENTSSWKQNYGTENDIYIFSVGRMVEEKGFQTIIDAAPSIRQRHPKVKFIIAGKGPLLEDYQSQVVAKGLANTVYFIGFIDDQLRNEILHSCDICLFPSYYEPFGIVALEGMMAQKPTIVSETGGLAEIITHNETGLTIFPRDVQSLIIQVVTCIENQSLASRIAENGKKLVTTKFNWNNISKETVSVYDDVISYMEV